MNGPARVLRLKKKLGLVELGRHTGLSAAMLSKIERGRLFPTLPTLLRISLVFGGGLEHFFLEARTTPTIAVIRREDRRRFPDRPGARQVAYQFESLDFPATERPMSAYYVEFEPDVASKPHQHEGAEVIYVIDGKLGVTINDEETVLRKGDSMYFDSSQPHAYRRASSGPCTALVTTAV
ncbi:MAG TPA: cupin domain-containing protein [Vicinamibacterales bacterium]|nr:cupin domain-containing protein [Vicinamibacterales bacterium]